MRGNGNSWKYCRSFLYIFVSDASIEMHVSASCHLSQWSYANALILVLKQKRGISSSRCASKRGKLGSEQCDDTSPLQICSQTNDEKTSDPIRHKKQKTTKSDLCAEPTVIGDFSDKACHPRYVASIFSWFSTWTTKIS